MVKFLKLPVLFRQMIYLMNKASFSISLPPSFPHLFCQRSKHALTPRFCSLVCLPYGGVSCEPHSSVDASTVFALCRGATVNHHLHSLHKVEWLSTPWVAVPSGQNYRRKGSLPASQVLQVYGAVQHRLQPFCAMFLENYTISPKRFFLLSTDAKAWKKKR